MYCFAVQKVNSVGCVGTGLPPSKHRKPEGCCRVQTQSVICVATQSGYLQRDKIGCMVWCVCVGGGVQVSECCLAAHASLVAAEIMLADMPSPRIVNGWSERLGIRFKARASLSCLRVHVQI